MDGGVFHRDGSSSFTAPGHTESALRRQSAGQLLACGGERERKTSARAIPWPDLRVRSTTATPPRTDQGAVRTLGFY